MRRVRRATSTGTLVPFLMTALLLAGCAGSTAPFAAPMTAESASAPRVTPTAPAAASSASPTATTQGGVAVSDLVGTWVGDLTTVVASGDPTKASVFSTRVTLESCVPKQTCGRFTASTTDLAGTGTPGTCDGTLTYRGFFKDRGAFEFEEKITSTTGTKRCEVMLMVFTPLARGSTLGVEEKHGMQWGTYGVLVKTATP